MKKYLFSMLVLVMFTGVSFGLTAPQAQANALNCIELIKLSAELSSPTLNNYMLNSNKILFDKQSGTVFIMEKGIGEIRFKYLDKNKKNITGKSLSEVYNNAYKNAAFFDVEISNKILYTAKLTVTYETPAKKHENLSITGALSVISGKEKIPYVFADKIRISEISLAKTVISGGILKSDGVFKDKIVIDFSKNQLKSASDKKAGADISFNTDKRSQKIDNLKYILSK